MDEETANIIPPPRAIQMVSYGKGVCVLLDDGTVLKSMSGQQGAVGWTVITPSAGAPVFAQPDFNFREY